MVFHEGIPLYHTNQATLESHTTADLYHDTAHIILYTIYDRVYETSREHVHTGKSLESSRVAQHHST